MTETTINGWMQHGQINLTATHPKPARRTDMREAQGLILGVLIGFNMWIVGYDVYLLARWFW